MSSLNIALSELFDTHVSVYTFSSAITLSFLLLHLSFIHGESNHVSYMTDESSCHVGCHAYANMCIATHVSYVTMCIATHVYLHTQVPFKQLVCHTRVSYINTRVYLHSILKNINQD